MNIGTKPPPPKYGLAIDWETSASSYTRPQEEIAQGLSFGAVIFDTETFEPIAKLYREIKYRPKGDQWWSPDAEKCHGLSIEYLEEHGVSQESAASDLAELIATYILPLHKNPRHIFKVLLLAHNAGFDAVFTEQLLKTIDININWFHVKLDSSVLGISLLNTYRAEDIFDYLGFDKRGHHNALDDILMTLEAFRMFKEIFTLGQEQLK